MLESGTLRSGFASLKNRVRCARGIWNFNPYSHFHNPPFSRIPNLLYRFAQVSGCWNRERCAPGIWNFNPYFHFQDPPFSRFPIPDSAFSRIPIRYFLDS